MSTNSENAARERDYAVLFSFLALSPTATPEKGGERILLKHGEKTMPMRTSQLALLASKGLIAQNGKKIELTETGRNYLPLNHERRKFQVSLVESGFVVSNKEESPLTVLAARKLPDGTAFLQPSEFEAGERIRTDFTRAMLMPRTSANWQASVSAGRRSGEANGVEDVTHSAIAARQRLDEALQCLGRDLAGVVADICCYLKGFEQVEMERKWPKRSAKFMLKAALSILALHYNPPAKNNRKSHKWATSDYRPKIS
jgi:hypothetical protein